MKTKYDTYNRWASLFVVTCETLTDHRGTVLCIVLGHGGYTMAQNP